MDFKYLLTEFDGRIPRSQFWIGVVCLVVVSLVLSFILGAVLPMAVASLIGTLIILYPAAAVYAKRLHDRNKPTTPWLYILIGPALLYALMSATGIGFSEMSVPGEDPVMVPSGPIGWLLSLAVMVVGIWALVELGILKGTTGANEFGADPLGQKELH